MAGGDEEQDLTDAGVLKEVYEEILERENAEPPTLSDWRVTDVENSPIAFINQFLNGGPIEDFDRFVLDSDISLEDDTEDSYVEWHDKKDISPVLWALLLKEARNLPSDEKLEFHLKGNPEIAERVGFDGRDDVPRNSTFWRAYADTDSNDPRFNEEAMNALKIEARKIVHHAKYIGFELPERADIEVTILPSSILLANYH